MLRVLATNVFTGNKCVGTGEPLLNKDGSCVTCADRSRCPMISGNAYYTAPNGTAPKLICGPGKLESGSIIESVPEDGGLALARAALGME